MFVDIVFVNLVLLNARSFHPIEISQLFNREIMWLKLVSLLVVDDILNRLLNLDIRYGKLTLITHLVILDWLLLLKYIFGLRFSLVTLLIQICLRVILFLSAVWWGRNFLELAVLKLNVKRRLN